MADGELAIGRGWTPRLVEFLGRDFEGWAARRLDWARRPATILAAAVVAAMLCGLYIHPRALVLGAGLLTVLAAGVAWPWLTTIGLSGELGFETARAREGRPVTLRLRVRNRAPWAAWGLVVRGGFDEADGPASGLACAPGFRTTEAAWEVCFDRRGVYPEGPPRVATGFPFGVREASRVLKATDCLIVWPATFPVGPIPEAAGSRESDGAAVRPGAGATGDPVGVRPYRRGDSIRRVHWPQSARHGTLIVCELEAHATPEVQIVVDVHPDAHAGDGADGSLEWAVRIAASFAEDWIGRGAEVEVVHAGGAIVAAGGSAAARRAQVMDALARLKPDAGKTLDELLDGPLGPRRAAGLRVVVATDRSGRTSPSRAGGGPVERFVVLSAGAFAGEGRLAAVPPEPRPWIWVDGPDDVAGQVRRGWKEVGIEALHD